MITGAEIGRMETYLSGIIPYFDPFIFMSLILATFGIFTYYVLKKDTGLGYLFYSIFSIITCTSVYSIFQPMLEHAESFVIIMILFFLLMAVLGVLEFIKKVRY